MDEQALNSLIKQRVEEAVTNVQTDMLKHMDRIITNSFDTFQRSVKENQRELSENSSLLFWRVAFKRKTRQNRRDEFWQLCFQTERKRRAVQNQFQNC